MSTGGSRSLGGGGGPQRDRAELFVVAAGSLVAGAGLFWATKQLLDYYIPYQVGRGWMDAFVRSGKCAYCNAPMLAAPPRPQYHYRPGTFSGWLAGVLNKYSKRRRGAPAPTRAPLADAAAGVVGPRARPRAAPEAARAPGPFARRARAPPMRPARRRAPRARVHGRLLRHDALWPRQRAAAGRRRRAPMGVGGPPRFSGAGPMGTGLASSRGGFAGGAVPGPRWTLGALRR
jgi:hypothetical protein